MNEETYLNLLLLVSPLIKKQDTVMRHAITPYERLTATLRFIVTNYANHAHIFIIKINYMAYGTRRYNAAFTRAHQ